jgi:DMSO/TMAO reductase YedYZ molybdopterin-dependent catalytic subunit
MAPANTTKRTVPPQALGSPVTETENVYVIGHFGIARVPDPGWSLRVDGLVGTQLRLDLEQLRALPAVSVTAVLECFGNPLRPDEPVRRVANVTWGGAPVRALLERAGALPGADSLWVGGLDSGRFGGRASQGYLKDVPLGVAADRGIVAYEMNGEPLTEEHGFPARLFVPGYFGTNNVKWLRSLTVAAGRPEHLFTTELYQRVPPGGRHPVPVRDLDVNSVLTGHSERAGVVTVYGWAWSATPVSRVQIGTDGTDGAWLDATVEPRRADAFGWQRFSRALRLGPGAHAVTARATDSQGRVQPLAGARNEVHTVTVTVPDGVASAPARSTGADRSSQRSPGAR